MEPAITLHGITKRFGPVTANDHVDLEVAQGSIHGIIGENGAGKSTLVSILAGHHRADNGTIQLFGETVKLNSSADAIRNGIGMVHQHFMLVQNFTVLENIMLSFATGPFLEKGRAEVRAKQQELADRFGLTVDPDALIEKLPVGLQQRVEIIKALIAGGRILILDEPTAVLSPQEADQLFDSVRFLKAQGVTVLLITHKLREIMAVTDNVSVMRGGKLVATRQTDRTNSDELAELMVGRAIAPVRNQRRADLGEPIMTLAGLSLIDRDGIARLSDIGLELHAGEIVGVAGVAGNGQSELLSVLAGMVPPSNGVIRIDERVITASAPSNPREIRRLGVAHVPEDRRKEGVVLPFMMQENAVLGQLRYARGRRKWLLKRGRMRKRCNELMTRNDVRPPKSGLAAARFSGGNQQKLVFGREIGTKPRVLLVGQPTRGVDIGSIEFIHRQMLALRDEGCAILIVSVELDEILALSDRIVVMNAGHIVGELDAEHADRQAIGLMMGGLSAEAPDRGATFTAAPPNAAAGARAGVGPGADQ